ncbi:unnamed protein product, partial [Sphacelaria rigidula]
WSQRGTRSSARRSSPPTRRIRYLSDPHGSVSLLVELDSPNTTVACLASVGDRGVWSLHEKKALWIGRVWYFYRPPERSTLGRSLSVKQPLPQVRNYAFAQTISPSYRLGSRARFTRTTEEYLH